MPIVLMRLPTVLLVSIFFLILSATVTQAQQSTPNTSLFEDELALVHQTNLIRRQHGLPPLRVNRELTEAARWFAVDSTNNRATGYCGHTDTLGRSAAERQADFGYINGAGWAENVVCGYAPPANALDAWMESEGHRANILSPAHREIGIGYYRDDAEGRGYIVQKFSSDPDYAPVIINDEAPTTESSSVQLYIYAPAPRAGFDGMDAIIEMMIANDVAFEGATWEPYTAEKRWQLADGDGWRTVYVRLRDELGRVLTTSDTIYVGTQAPVNGLTLDHASSIEETVEFSADALTDWAGIQFRLNWVADDQDPSFAHNGTQSGRIRDAGAIGGTAYRLSGPNGEGAAVLRSSTFHKEVPMVAYICLKVDDNHSQETIASITIEGGGVTYGPLELAGTDFTADGEYQFFQLPFTFHEDDQYPFLEVHIDKQGDADLYFDAVTFFSTPLPTADTIAWQVPGNYYRGDTVWARLTRSDGGFSPAIELGEAGVNIPSPEEATVPGDPADDANEPAPQAVSQRLFLPLTIR